MTNSLPAFSRRPYHQRPRWAGVGRHLPRKEGVVPARQPWSDYQRGPGGDLGQDNRPAAHGVPLRPGRAQRGSDGGRAVHRHLPA